MLIQAFFLLALLSLEATVGLPWFFLYLLWRWQRQLSVNVSIVLQFAAGLLLAVFYGVSWPLVTLLLLLLHLGFNLVSGQRWQVVLRLVALLLWQLAFWWLADLSWSLWGLAQVVLFATYVIVSRVKNYAN